MLLVSAHFSQWITYAILKYCKWGSILLFTPYMKFYSFSRLKSCIVYSFFYFFFLMMEIFNIFPIIEYAFIWLAKKIRRGNKRFDIHLWRIRSVHLLSEDGKDASCEGRVGWQKLFISRQSWHFCFDFHSCKYFHICTLTWLVNNYVSRQGKSIKRRNEKAETENKFSDTVKHLAYLLKIWLLNFPIYSEIITVNLVINYSWMFFSFNYGNSSR